MTMENVSRTECKELGSDALVIRPVRRSESFPEGEFIFEFLKNGEDIGSHVIVDKAVLAGISEDIVSLLEDLAAKQLTDLISDRKTDDK